MASHQSQISDLSKLGTLNTDFQQFLQDYPNSQAAIERKWNETQREHQAYQARQVLQQGHPAQLQPQTLAYTRVPTPVSVTQPVPTPVYQSTASPTPAVQSLTDQVHSVTAPQYMSAQIAQTNAPRLDIPQPIAPQVIQPLSSHTTSHVVPPPRSVHQPPLGHHYPAVEPRIDPPTPLPNAYQHVQVAAQGSYAPTQPVHEALSPVQQHNLVQTALPKSPDVQRQQSVPVPSPKDRLEKLLAEYRSVGLEWRDTLNKFGTLEFRQRSLEQQLLAMGHVPVMEDVFGPKAG
ncbi:hypothetical protein ACLX1H_011305 [Fusarium chlamydosporum]